jgi:dienelactone hydrolase
VKKEFAINTKSGKQITFDVSHPDKGNGFPVAILCHGFKGFKDWGPFNWIAEQFVANGLCLVKMNFSHNGLGESSLTEFTDLNSFGENTINQELEDIQLVKEELQKEEWKEVLDLDDLAIIGHSRGGASALITAIEDEDIKKVITWATISDLNSWISMFNDEDWKTNGKIFIKNGRTGQDMPVNYSFYEDVKSNSNKYDILKRSDELSIPVLLLHGENDESVNPSSSQNIYDLVLHSIYICIEGANHTFGGIHPFNSDKIPEDLDALVENTIEFITE